MDEMKKEHIIDIKIIKDICFNTENKKPLHADLYLPSGLESFPLLVFFYGGGLENGDKKQMAHVALEYVQNGIAVALPNYRSYPEVSYPSFIVDASYAVKFFEKEIKKYGNCEGLFIGGHSAGAYLSLMLSFDPYYFEQIKFNPSKICGVISASGQPTTHFNILKYRGIQADWVVIDEAAPVFHITENGPPLNIYCTDNDIKNRLEQTEFFVKTLKEFDYTSEVDYQFVTNHDHMSYLQSVLIDKSVPFIRKYSDKK